MLMSLNIVIIVGLGDMWIVSIREEIDWRGTPYLGTLQ
jgi:hypothetical protein